MANQYPPFTGKCPNPGAPGFLETMHKNARPLIEGFETRGSHTNITDPTYSEKQAMTPQFGVNNKSFDLSVCEKGTGRDRADSSSSERGDDDRG